MAAASLTARPPLPVGLRADLPDLQTPWGISQETFAQMQAQQGAKFKKVEILPTSPEWRWVWRYFHHDKPTQYDLARIYCIHERHQQQAFELTLSSQEREAETFPPTWNEEPRAAQRIKAIERWKETTAPFSPFSTFEQDGRRRIWKKTKVLPLWHGSSHEVCQSIAKSGFVYFGKNTLGKTSSDPKNTDFGFFGSGIYFTNSPRYAADIYSRGHLILAWVSMREPFPVVGDPFQQDMQTLRGQGAYKSYNAHYIPVVPEEKSPTCALYYPCQKDQNPLLDELVVFQKTQTLPRFWLELAISLPHLKQLSAAPQLIEELIPHLHALLQHPAIDQDKRLRNYLNIQLAQLMQEEPEEYLEEAHEALFQQLQQLLLGDKVNRTVAKALTGSKQSKAAPTPSSPAKAPAATKYNKPLALAKAPIPAPKAAAAAAASGALTASSTVPGASPGALPAIAFGAAKWKTYFGDVGKEPPLPKDIAEILKSPCPFWPGKRVEETHLLTLIPKTVDGKLFCLDLLGELIQHPKGGGRATKYEYYWDKLQDHLGKTTPKKSYWTLMTRDILEETRGEPCQKNCALLDAKRGNTPYKPPGVLEAATAILMHYTEKGERLFSGKPPWRRTYCREEDGCEATVGGFVTAGLNFHDRSFFGTGLAALRRMSHS